MTDLTGAYPCSDDDTADLLPADDTLEVTGGFVPGHATEDTDPSLTATT